MAKSQIKAVAEVVAEDFHRIASAIYDGKHSADFRLTVDDERVRIMRAILDGADEHERLIVCQFFAEMQNIDDEPFRYRRSGRRLALDDLTWKNLRFLFNQLTPEGYEAEWVARRPNSLIGPQSSADEIAALFAVWWKDRLAPALEIMCGRAD